MTRSPAVTSDIVEAFTGVGLLAVVAMWMVFMIPSALRYRSQLVAAHADDRFSGDLRIVATGKQTASVGATMLKDLQQPIGETGPGRSAGAIHASAPRQVSGTVGAGASQRGKGQAMTTTSAMPAAVRTRRAAAARRRAFLTVALLGITLGMVGAGFATSMAMAAAVIPGAMLVSVLVMGRRAVIANAKADAERGWTGAPAGETAKPAARAASRPAARPVAREASSHTTVLPRVRPSAPASPVAAPSATMPASLAPSFTMGSDADQPVEVADSEQLIADAAPVAIAETASETVLARSSSISEEAWQPVPTPRPTYATKAPAPRREPRPLEAFDPAMLSAGPGRSASRSAEVEAAEAAGKSEPVEPQEPAPTTLSGGLHLDAVLARRRAIG